MTNIHYNNSAGSTTILFFTYNLSVQMFLTLFLLLKEHLKHFSFLSCLLIKNQFLRIYQHLYFLGKNSIENISRSILFEEG